MEIIILAVTTVTVISTLTSIILWKRRKHPTRKQILELLMQNLPSPLEFDEFFDPWINVNGFKLHSIVLEHIFSNGKLNFDLDDLQSKLWESCKTSGFPWQCPSLGFTDGDNEVYLWSDPKNIHRGGFEMSNGDHKLIFSSTAYGVALTVVDGSRVECEFYEPETSLDVKAMLEGNDQTKPLIRSMLTAFKITEIKPERF